MCLPKRCERLETYFIIILSSTCALAAASPMAVRHSHAMFAAVRIRVYRLDENIRAHLRLYLMVVIVHGLHALTNTRRICNRPTSVSAVATAPAVASSSFTFSYLFGSPLDISYNFSISFRQIYTSYPYIVRWGCNRRCDTITGSQRKQKRQKESELYNMTEDVKIIIIIILRVRRMMIGNGRGLWAKAGDTYWDFDVIKLAHIFFLTTS